MCKVRATGCCTEVLVVLLLDDDDDAFVDNDALEGGVLSLRFRDCEAVVGTTCDEPTPFAIPLPLCVNGLVAGRTGLAGVASTTRVGLGDASSSSASAVSDDDDVCCGIAGAAAATEEVAW